LQKNPVKRLTLGGDHDKIHAVIGVCILFCGPH